MRSFVTPKRASKLRGATAALAIALAMGSVVGLTGPVEPAHAAKKDKKSGGGEYSKEFKAVYGPLEEKIMGEAGDAAGAKAEIPGLITLLKSDDEKYVGGNLVYNTGVKTDDLAMRMQGMDLMLASGKVPAEKLGDYYYQAYQLAIAVDNYDAARNYLQATIDKGISFSANMSDGSVKTFTADDIRMLIAQSYWTQDRTVDGLDYLNGLIAERIAANQPVPKDWITRGLAQAYDADDAPRAGDFASYYVRLYPSVSAWGDAIAIQRNLGGMDAQTTLDLLRLAARTKSLRVERDYIDYIEVADARRLPGEVTRVISEGVGAGILKANDITVVEQRDIANGRLKADKAELPALERDARSASATAVTASAAGDAFLSYGDAAKAEEMYRIALSKPGVDTPRILTRLGIAQADQGKGAEAADTFAKVDGARRIIAKLWAAYAAEKAAPAVSAEAEVTAQ